MIKMNATKRKNIFKKLGEYAYYSNGEVAYDRIWKFEKFKRVNRLKYDNIEISINNEWGFPPNRDTAKKSVKIGHTTYDKEIWAIVRKNK